MHRPLTRSESALVEIGLMFLPGIPALIWLWPRVSDTPWETPANVAVYVYFIVGMLLIGLRRWSWSKIGINRHGIGLSLACGAMLILARLFALASTNIPFVWQLTTLDRFIGEVVFYFALVGLGEELIFRGVAYRALEEWRGTRWSIWLSTLGFGIWHIGGRGIAGMAAGIFYGIFFATIRWRAGGIVGLIIAHALIDLTTVAIVPNIEMNYLLTQVRVVNSWFAISSEIIFIGLLIYLWKAPRRQNV